MIGATLTAAAFMIAQPAYPSRIDPPGVPARPRTGARGNDAEAQRVMIDFASCVAQRSRSSLERFLAQPFGSDDADRLAFRLATPDCLFDAELRFSQEIFRGALYDALYRIDFVRMEPADLSAVPPITYYVGATESLTPRQHRRVGQSLFADCVVRAAPSEARALILSAATSPTERAAFQALQPALGPCLVQGAQVRFSRPMLRGLVAESLYRLTSAASSSANRVR